MGYQSSNAAYAYDMRAESYASDDYRSSAAPQVEQRPRLDVVTGAGREANQAVSPVFTSVVKAFCVLAALFCIVGLVRVTVAGFTASVLNNNAAMSSELEAAQEQSSNLEVMRSVYGADTRVRDLAAGTLGMVDAEGGVTIDLSQGAGAPAAQ